MVRRERPIYAPLLPPSFLSEFVASSCKLPLKLGAGKGRFQRLADLRWHGLAALPT
jgi:hypothetical protein